ncbi:lysM domain receptor-like kinase 3 [Cannabis sativa]|uniref:lysM domain receptor-like kinase 3 n=1 Tax=Cannabis sativa TaxID=3483 RepID=UPI0029C9F9C2|nr:lysM domain receptor-like kinase 3 [Cannabis sativa]
MVVRTSFLILLAFQVFLLLSFRAKAKCKTGCNLALASYFVWEGSNLSYISTIFGQNFTEILRYNPQVPNKDSIITGTRINVPFSCECLNTDFLGHTFTYKTQFGDTYDKVAEIAFANLTTEDWVHRVNRYKPTRIPAGSPINVTVNCTCGDRHVSKDYGLFATYPLRSEDNLSSVAAVAGVPPELLELYNPGQSFSAGNGIVFVPTKDGEGNFRPLKSSIINEAGISRRDIAGISVAAIAGTTLVAFGIYFGVLHYKRNNKLVEPLTLLPVASDQDHGCGGSCSSSKQTISALSVGSTSTGITVEKSVEFSYQELAKATNDFSLDNKIGQGGFGSVYYAELRGEKAALKKMDMQASNEFLAELRILTHVHHLNLVRLIGFCVEGSLFLVYEYIENGNLSQHLRGSGRDPLTWSSRVQIALDSARGLEYIHEHTVPLYIHRDIKSPNILIDKNFRGKVADFGLTKLTEYGSTSLQTRLVGTFGYMPPEYAQYGDVSPKVDVYAFGVVLYELISAKEAVVRTKESPTSTESKALVALFEDVLTQPDPKEDLIKLIDPRLGQNYPFDSVLKMAQLAKACTHDSPQLRPSMRSIVVALMTLTSTTEDWDVGSFYENQALTNLMTGR